MCLKDPDKPIVEWVEKMFADRRNSPSAPPDITPLHMAIYKQHPHVARLLIEKGANVKIKDQFGLTPIMLCALRSKSLSHKQDIQGDTCTYKQFGNGLNRSELLYMLLL